MRLDGSRSLSTLLVALLLVTFPAGCSRGSDSGAGTLDTNRAFWNELSGGTLPSYALDALNVASATTPSRAQLLKIRACSQLWIDTLDAQDKRIAAVKRQDVDAELRGYADELASTHSARIAVLSELRLLVDSPPRAGLLSEKLDALDALQARLVASELTVRAHLVGRFGQEFSPQADARAPDPPTVGTPSPKSIDAQRMKFDLIGREVAGWEFESLDEFVTFEVRQSRTDSQVAVFAVFTQVRGARSGTTQELSLAIGYKAGPHAWELMRVSPN